MKFKILFHSAITAILLAAGQAWASMPDYVSGIPNHIGEESFSERVQGGERRSAAPDPRSFPIQWMAAGTIITASHHAAFIGNRGSPVGSVFYVPQVMQGGHWALFGAVLILLGMLARSRIMPRP